MLRDVLGASVDVSLTTATDDVELDPVSGVYISQEELGDITLDFD